jgi:hypothetical protein
MLEAVKFSMNRDIVSRADVDAARQRSAAEKLAPRGAVRGLPAADLSPPSNAVPNPDTYVQRLMKYIPAEVIAAYMTLAGILNSSQQKDDPTLHWIIFGVAVAGGVGYLRRTGVRKALQLVLSILALIVWIYYLGGPFKAMGWHQELYAALLLPAYTFLVPLVEP